MITDDELAAAIAGRLHWLPAGADTAVYMPPGTSVSVRVQRAAHPTKFDRYVATTISGGVARHVMPHHNAVQRSPTPSGSGPAADDA